MAVYSKHPAAAPPSAPERDRTGQIVLRAWFTFVLFAAFTTPGWTFAIGVPGTIALAVGTIAITGIVVGVLRPPIPWHRMPWVAGSFVMWAGASIVWSSWRETSALTWLLLLGTTFLGIAIASLLTWREIVRAVAAALAWSIGLSLVFELTVALVVGGPLYAGFATTPADGAALWTHGAALQGGRLDGFVGDANLLGMTALMGVIVFVIEYAARDRWRSMRVVWAIVSVVTLAWAGSVTAWSATAAVALVLATVLLMRTARRPGKRTWYYAGYAALAAGGGLALWFFRAPIFAALGRNDDLAAGEAVWDAVRGRIAEHPFIGGGFATPWLPWDPAFAQWTVLPTGQAIQAQSVWLDVLFQLGAVGVVLYALTMLAFVWRSWFFAVDRPRWDLRADRPYSALTLLPTLTATVLLVQGISDTAPLFAWGWMLMIVLGSKIKQSPHVGEGPAEQRMAIERGELLRR